MVRLLVVDDEALVRTGFQHILDTADDIEAVGRSFGGQAVRAVRELRTDVVLLDIRMPDVDGFTVLAEVRRLPDPPVVLQMTRQGFRAWGRPERRAGAATGPQGGETEPSCAQLRT